MSSGRFSAVRASTWLATLLALQAPLAGANIGDTFRPLVSYSYVHEDNLFRLSDGLSGVPLALAAPNGKSDDYQTLGVGFNIDWQQARQRVLIKALANQTRFSQYPLLDYDGRDLSGEWQWQLGNHLRGNLGTSQVRSMGSYQDIGNLVSSVRTRTNHTFSATHQFHPNGDLELRLNRQALDYSAAALTASNFTQDDIALGGFYKGGMVERLGLEWSGMQGDFPDRPAGGAQATGYRGHSVKLVANVQVTGKSRLRARVGYLSREYEGGNTQDFSGMNGRIDWDWVPSGKTMLNFALFRELNNTELAGATQQSVHGASASAQWQPRAKLVLGLSARSETQAYDGTTLDDRISSLGASASYTPWRDSSITLSAQRQSRSSTAALRDFDATVLALSAEFRF